MSFEENYAVDDANAIAIVGMAGRFPESDNIEQFWQNIRDGVDCVKPVSDEELEAAGITADLYNQPNYHKVASTISGIQEFDAEFFGITPREAEVMDPQARLFLECAWEAIEHAGYNPYQYEGAIGLFAGTAISNYLFENLMPNREKLAAIGERQVLMVNEKDFLCGRAAFELNLKGPVAVVQTACSTSLVAIHMACQSVLNGECDMALAGGVSIQMLQKRGYLYQEGGLTSADGHCRAFDENATGIVSGNGLGLIVVKSYEAALEDGDTIHAIIRGSAINNDGDDKASFAAPSVEGQAAVISEAQEISGVDPETIGYIEAHGTGTMLGDPIEMSALTQAFQMGTDKTQYCGVGSLKTNMGHLDVAAGVAGLMKAVMALKHQAIPPSLHYTNANPHIDFESSPFYVNTQLQQWKVDGSPRRAGVSSFGIGGTNAHVILEEAVNQTSDPSSEKMHTLNLSARTPVALEKMHTNLSDFISKNPETNIADVAFTLNHGKQAFNYRNSVTVRDAKEAVIALQQPVIPTVCNESWEQQDFLENEREGAPEFVFLFPGGGTQYINMTRSLYEKEAVFKNQIDQCAQLLQARLDFDFRDILFPAEGQEAQAEKQIHETGNTLPILFSIEYAMVKLLESWGIKPSAMVGHSLGEYVAATVAGVFNLQDALTVVTQRGRLIHSLPTGNMLAVLDTSEVCQDYIKKTQSEQLWLACENSRGACTVAGTPESTAKMAALLEADGIEHQLLEGWPGSHSGLMNPILDDFRAVFEHVKLSAPCAPYLSNLTGDWIQPEQATDPEYWVSHLNQTVKFSSCVEKLLENPRHVYVETGPGKTLVNLLQRDVVKGSKAICVATIPKKTEAKDCYNEAHNFFGKLWCQGLEAYCMALYAEENRKRLPLPTYPFDRKRYWIDAPNQSYLEQDIDTSEHMHSDAEESELHTSNRPALPTEYAAATGDTEEKLVQIWQSLLGVAPVGIHDDFFLLGGSSLIAIQLTARIRSEFSVSLPLKSLFETPTVAAQALEIEAVQSGSDSVAESSTDTVIPKRKKQEKVLASYAQQRVWFIEQLDPNAGPAFHIPAAMKLEGALNVEQLQETLNILVGRHESLRTTFSADSQHVYQHICAADAEFELTFEDLSHCSALDQDVKAAQLQASFLGQRFDLENGPLVRAILIRLSAESHILMMVQHHIISDGWSIGVMIDEVSKVYQAIVAGEKHQLPPLAIQYADYSEWQQESLTGEALENKKQFWKDYLADTPEVTALPLDRQRQSKQSYQGDYVPFALSKEVTHGLKALSKAQGTTLFMTLLAGWSTLLSRLGGDEDIVIGSPVANRQYEETENVIGYFVNTVAFRSKPLSNLSFVDYLQQVKTATLAAYEHQDVPFEQVVEAVQPSRSVSHTPVFQVMLNLHNTPNYRELELEGLTLHGIELEQTTTQFDLMMSLTDAGDEIGGDIRFVTALFDKETIEKMTQQFIRLMENVVFNHSLKLAEVNLLSDAELNDVTETFAKGINKDLPCHLAHQLFEHKAEENPSAIALEFENQSVSYQSLNQQANQLANYLLSLGVETGDRVAVCLDKGIECVVSVLATMKAGATYVPVDANYPQDRVQYMLSDCAPKVVITLSQLLPIVASASSPCTAIALDNVSTMLKSLDSSNIEKVASVIAPSTNAYMIYTSGSTGNPKGVLNKHESLVNLADAQIDAFGVSMNSKVLQFASFGFDACVSEIMMALGSGATLVMAKQDLLMPGEPLQKTINHYGITHVTVPPSVLGVWESTDVVSPMTFIVAGEQCPLHIAQTWSTTHRLINAYGPSEAAVCATINPIETNACTAAISIGKPIQNCSVYVLNDSLKPVPVGAVGDIYIGGLGVANGYFNRDALNVQRFINNPLSQNQSDRLYRTGDLGKWMPNGELVFLGRDDDQVKLRGFRIELGEIAHQLTSYPSINDSIALVHKTQSGQQQLVAFVLTDSVENFEQINAIADVKAKLRAFLPEYMVPSVIIAIDAFPKTPNGKIDQKALIASIEAHQKQRTFEAPAGTWEETLADIWCELLQLEQVDRHDNFFEIGGSSLIASQMMSRIEESLEVDLPLAQIFQTPHLVDLAKELNQLVIGQLGDMGELEISELEQELENLSEEELEALLNEELAEETAE